MTGWLFFSIAICVFGNSFLYGYNIGVVNSPAKIIKAFYAQMYMARDNVMTRYEPQDGGLYYIDTPPSTSAPNVTKLPTTYVVTYALPSSNSSDIGNSTVAPPRDPLLAKSAKEIEDDNFLEIMWSITVAVYVLFGMVGAFSSGKIADFFGRKKGMIVITFLMFFAGIFGGIPIVAKSPECLVVSRAFVGLHCGINISLASLYLAEISPKKIRGSVGTCHQLFITIGILWSMVLGLPECAGSWTVCRYCLLQCIPISGLLGVNASLPRKSTISSDQEKR